MISIERTKELLEREDMSDEEAETIHNAVRALVEIVFEQYRYEQNTATKDEGNHN